MSCSTLQLNGAAAAQPAGCADNSTARRPGPPGSAPAPAISLRDQHGQRVTLASLRGSTVALTFFDSLCKESCPIEGQMLGAAIRQVGSASRPRLLVVSVDPAGDTPQTVRRALRKWHLPADTIWLMGTRSALKPVWDAYQITVEPVSGDIVHSTAVYLIDRERRRAGGIPDAVHPRPRRRRPSSSGAQGARLKREAGREPPRGQTEGSMF